MAAVDVEIRFVHEAVDRGAVEELVAEVGHVGVDREARGREKIADEFARVFVADGDADRGGRDAGGGERVGAQFAVRGERGAQDYVLLWPSETWWPNIGASESKKRSNVMRVRPARSKSIVKSGAGRPR